MSKNVRKTYNRQRALQLRRNFSFIHKYNDSKCMETVIHKMPRYNLWKKPYFYNHKQINYPTLNRYRGNRRLNS